MGIINKNLKLMDSGEEGGMMTLYTKESMGGLPGTYKGYPCVALNFVFDPKTGEIFYFDVPQHIPEYLIEKTIKGQFKMAIDFSVSGRRGIVDISIIGNAEREALIVIADSVKAYNKLHNFPVD